MKELLNKFLTISKLIRAQFPSKLPVGLTEFNKWAASVLELCGNYADEDSMKFALASMIIHADAKYGSLPKAYFITRMRKVAANQVASQVFQDIKQKQAEAAAKKQAEDTAAQEKAPNEPPKKAD